MLTLTIALSYSIKLGTYYDKLYLVVETPQLLTGSPSLFPCPSMLLFAGCNHDRYKPIIKGLLIMILSCSHSCEKE